MNYGYVCVSNTKKSFQSSVIRFFTQSSWSHSFITIPDLVGTPLAMEAAGSGVSICSFNKHYRDDKTQAYKVYRFRADPIAIDSALAQLLVELQTGYGYLELPWFAWRGLNKMFGRDISSQDNWSQAGRICSELVAQYITYAGYPQLLGRFGRGSINAQDIFEMVESNPEIFELIESKE